MRVVEQYLLQLNTEKQRLHRAVAVLTLLSLVVVVSVGWNLRMTGITMANDACCGIPEHIHTEQCLSEPALVCGYPEEPPMEVVLVERIVEVPAAEEWVADPEAPAEEMPIPETTTEVVFEEVLVPVHTHNEVCTQVSYICGFDEHIHEIYCYCDPGADLESAEQWEADLPRLSDRWADNLAMVAQSQLGNCESERNFALAEDGWTQNGITRYGQWYGNPYGDWSSMFTLFCLHYAQVPQEAVPWSPGVQNMLAMAQQQEILSQPDTTPGNLIFVDTDENGSADHILIVVDNDGDIIFAVSGDWDNAVSWVEISVHDSRILGCINVDALQRAWEEAASPEPTEPEATEPEATDPTEPEATDPTEPEATDPTEPETTDPTEPEATDPMEPEATDPTEPEQTEPEPTEPETKDPTQPEETEPGDPDDTKPENPEKPDDSEQSEETEKSGETEDSELTEESEEDSSEPSITIGLEEPQEGILWLVAETANFDDSGYLWQWQVSEDGNDPWTDIEGAESFVLELENTEENAMRYYRLQGREAPMTPMLFAISRGDSSTTQEGGTITSGAVSPYSITKSRNVYTIDVYAIPVDNEGDRIPDIRVTTLADVSVRNETHISVADLFDTDLGVYDSAYFGTETRVTVDDIADIWRYRVSNTNYYLAYSKTDGTVQNRWKNSADNSISLYLRYHPNVTVTFASEDRESVTENVAYGGVPTLTEPNTWTREGYALAGWLAGNDKQTVHTFEWVLQQQVYEDVTYTAKWMSDVTVSFDLGEYADYLYSEDPIRVGYGSSLDQYPTPVWKDVTAAMSFDGWYLDSELTQIVGRDHQFFEDTTLYAKWIPSENGYFVYYMDFVREGYTPLVLMTASVTEGKTASAHVPSNAPEGKAWDGSWYLDPQCSQIYDFRIPVSQMTDYLTGANGRDLYLYPGTKAVCRAIFVTYGSRIDPVTVPVGESLNLDELVPTREGYSFAGWVTADGTKVSGRIPLEETTTFYATWDAGYVPFEALLRVENANDTGMSQANVLGTWYAKAGSQIRVKSTYSKSGTSRTGTHTVVCVLDGVEYPVYTNEALNRQATLADVYSRFFLYNNTGTTWTDEVNWDDVYTGGELPYSTRPVSSAGDSIITFDYMRLRRDITFKISNTYGYIDIYKLYQSGLITGSVTYTGTKPTKEGQNVSATGVSGTNQRWTYTASTGTNNYTLHNVKYDQRIYEDYPVGGSWITLRTTRAFRYYKTGNSDLFASRRENASSDFFSNNTNGRAVTATSFNAEFSTKSKVALMYAVECLSGETADFTLNNVGYKVQTQLCEVVNSSTDFTAKDLSGCVNMGEQSYTGLSNTNATIGGTSVRTLFGTTYWDYYKVYNGITSLSKIDKAYIFHYNRLRTDVQFNFGYDTNGDEENETVTYESIAYGESISQYVYGAANGQKHPLLEREGYEFAGWMDGNGFLLKDSDWETMVATGEGDDSVMIFIAKWEKISGNIVEYYEDVSAAAPFETHYFDDGEFLQYPTMVAYPQGWVWQEYGEGDFQRFDWDVPMYGEQGTAEYREVAGEERLVNVIRIYGTWDETHTRVVYDPNPAQGGIPGTAPVDGNEYTIMQSEVSVMSWGNVQNMDPDMVFAGWLLDRDGIVYQPGDHVAVRWPRTMIFTAQWTKREEAIYLRYDPNGGTPVGLYPNEQGLSFRKNARTVVWDNDQSQGTPWFSRTGFTFLGWNTQPDGNGVAYSPGSNITLTEPVTTLYAQWRRDIHSFQLLKQDHDSHTPLPDAIFDLYKQEDGQFLLVDTQTSGSDGMITFKDVETATVYKLVEARPPGGYGIMTREVCFSLIPEGPSVSFTFCDANGNPTDTPSGVSAEYISGNNHLMFTVSNVAGIALPATGGVGIPLYILFGVILTFAPFVYVFKLRRIYERRADR